MDSLRHRPLRVAVLGLGLIGGSVALGILDHQASTAGTLPVGADHATLATVVGWDPDDQTRAAAAEQGIQIARTAIAAVDNADLVVLCGPLKTLAATAREIAPHLGPHAMITDVGSVKSAVRRAMMDAGLNDRYVGAHPMAGMEVAGFSAARADLLRGATWALTVDDNTVAANVMTLLEFVTSVFAARVIVLDDHSHDAAAAIISHVPHVLAHALLGHAAMSAQRVVAQRLAAGSFRDGTRVARLNPARNQAMVEDNREAVISSLRLVMADLGALVSDLETGTDTSEFFNRALDWEPPRDSTEQVVEVDAVTWRQEMLQLGAHGSLITGVTVARTAPHTAVLAVERA